MLVLRKRFVGCKHRPDINDNYRTVRLMRTTGSTVYASISRHLQNGRDIQQSHFPFGRHWLTQLYMMLIGYECETNT